MKAEDAIASAMAGAREAHLAQLRKQVGLVGYLTLNVASTAGDVAQAKDVRRLSAFSTGLSFD